MKEIDEILYELQETYGYTIEELDHIHDLILEFGIKMYGDRSANTNLELIHTKKRSQ